MSRYIDTKTKTTKLDNIAFRFYKDPTLWWFIARVNNLKTMNVNPGLSLRVPRTLENAKGR